MISLTAQSLAVFAAEPKAFPAPRGRGGKASAAHRTRPEEMGPGETATAFQAPAARAKGAGGVTESDAAPPAAANPGARAQDALILAIARDRDRAAFVDLYEHYAPRVKSYLLRLGGADAAEEMAQETLLVVWRKAALFDPQKASAGTWIFTIARNLFIDRKRKEKRPELDPSDPMLASEADPAADVALATRRAEQKIRAALRDLPPEQAEVIALSFFEDKPHSAIAAQLNLPLGTVKSRLRLAFARLRGALGESIGERP